MTGKHKKTTVCLLALTLMLSYLETIVEQSVIMDTLSGYKDVKLAMFSDAKFAPVSENVCTVMNQPKSLTIIQLVS